MEQKGISWLLEGDPAIRWQVQRDLLDAPPEVYLAERQRVAETGWGAALLARQDPENTWGGGIYSPKWISTTYTLLLLRQLGLPPDTPQAQRACALFWQYGLYKDGGINFSPSFKHSETCINGMLVALLSYFGDPDERIHSVAEYLLKEQMPDGGWNCRRVRGATHGSFHTTISVLEGLAEYRLAYPEQGERTLPASQRGHEFLLLHRLYHSHRTGEIADQAFTRMVFPPRWHYDFLRALDYFQAIQHPIDERMREGIDLLQRKQTAGGCWLSYQGWPGKVFFKLEPTGIPGRWNTLRALRVLKWWNKTM
ncbi:MAG: hypothetical protein MUC85_06080 [Anaerolineales bacterium]|jgi:hypothetical protein|nr:hypothetical protein [Anaerolineales bacterium]